MATNQNIAVLLDVENINNVATLDKLMMQLQTDGDVTVKRAIGDWSKSIRVVKEGIQGLGFDLINQPNLAPGHNSADTKLVIETVELLHDPNHELNTFAFISSDQDFLPLYDRLREMGKNVIVAGDHSSNSRRIEQHVDKFIPLRDAQDNVVAVSYYPKARKTRRGGVRVARRGVDKNVRGEIGKLIYNAMIDAVDENDVASPRKLYDRMKRINPKFSVKALGYSKFGKMLRSFPDIVKVRGRRSKYMTVKLVRQPESNPLANANGHARNRQR